MKRKSILRQKKYKNEVHRQANRLISRMRRKNMLPELPPDSSHLFIINTDTTHNRTRITGITALTMPIFKKQTFQTFLKSDITPMIAERPTVMENIGRKWFE